MNLLDKKLYSIRSASTLPVLMILSSLNILESNPGITSVTERENLSVNAETGALILSLLLPNLSTCNLVSYFALPIESFTKPNILLITGISFSCILPNSSLTNCPMFLEL